MARELKLDKDKILSQLKELQSMSNDWSLEYDSDIDQPFYGPKIIPKGSFLFQINSEINLFVDKNSRVSGMFVEYFKVNYLEHNQELKPVLDVLEEADNEPADVQQIERVALEKDLFFDAFTSLLARDELITAVA